MEDIAQKQKVFYQKQNEERFFRFAEGYERGTLWREEQRLRAQEAELAALDLHETAAETSETSPTPSESALSEILPSAETEKGLSTEEASLPIAEKPKSKGRTRKKANESVEEAVAKPKRSRSKKVVNEIENTPSESDTTKENALSNSVLDKVNKRRNTPRT
ncbi:MAG: hypothetical protein HC912_04475 [Saprospiraceae bacterium]|nr:hypothetical protein [Saprospiraceae bacterium]